MWKAIFGKMMTKGLLGKMACTQHGLDTNVKDSNRRRSELQLNTVQRYAKVKGGHWKCGYEVREGLLLLDAV
jgi:hypothetical protein